MVFDDVAHLPKIRFVADGISVPVEQKFNKITAAEVALRRPPAIANTFVSSLGFYLIELSSEDFCCFQK